MEEGFNTITDIEKMISKIGVDHDEYEKFKVYDETQELLKLMNNGEDFSLKLDILNKYKQQYEIILQLKEIDTSSVDFEDTLALIGWDKTKFFSEVSYYEMLLEKGIYDFDFKYMKDFIPDSFSTITQERRDKAFWGSKKGADGLYDREEADSVLRKKTEREWARWTEEEREVAYNYTSGSCYINEPLYTKYYGTKKGVHDEIRDSQHDIDVLTKMIDNAEPLDTDMWFNRGVGSKGEIMGIFGVDLNDYISHPQDLVGLVGVNKPFCSTGHTKAWGFVDTGEDNDFDTHIVVNIFCPRGTKGIYTEPYSAYGWLGGNGYKWDGKTKYPLKGEVEFIIQRGGTYKITKAEYKNRMWFIDYDLIKQI